MVVEGEGPWGSVVWQRGALALEVPLSLEEPVLLGPPEGLGKAEDLVGALL